MLGGDQEKLKDNTEAKKVRRQAFNQNADTRRAATLEGAGQKTLAKFGGSKAGKFNVSALNNAKARLAKGNIKGAAAAAVKVAEQFGYDKAFWWLVGLIIPSFGLTIFALAILYILAKMRKAPLALWQRLSIIVLNAIYLFLIGLILFILLYAYCNSLYGKLGSTGAQLAAKYVYGIEIPDFCEVFKKFTSFNQNGVVDTSAVGSGGGQISGADRCKVIPETVSSNVCRPSNLQGRCNWDANEASRVCHSEGGGFDLSAPGKADPCLVVAENGNNLSTPYQYPISIGPFQINILDSYSPTFDQVCRNVLQQTGCEKRSDGGTYCALRRCVAPRGRAALDACRAAVSNFDNHIKQACHLYRNRCWSPWYGARDCGLNTDSNICKR